jgi:hypothetical protein
MKIVCIGQRWRFWIYSKERLVMNFWTSNEMIGMMINPSNQEILSFEGKEIINN